jgi:hypothetical protein
VTAAVFVTLTIFGAQPNMMAANAIIAIRRARPDSPLRSIVIAVSFPSASFYDQDD